MERMKGEWLGEGKANASHFEIGMAWGSPWEDKAKAKQRGVKRMHGEWLGEKLGRFGLTLFI